MARCVQRGLLSAVVSGLLIITLVGCGQRGAAKDAPPVTPASSDTPSATPTTPAPPPQRPKAPVPADRDPAAVSAALIGLDPCALLARATVKVPGLPANAELDRMDPHTCNRSSDGTGTDAQISVDLGNGVDTPDRFHEEALTVAGVKAYFFHFGVDKPLEYERCRVGIPVSFQDAIDVEIQLASTKERVDLCRQLAIAAAVPVAKALATPQAFPNRLPKAHRDACVVLAQALGEPLTYPGFRHIGSVDWCKKEIGKRSIGVRFNNFRLDRTPEKTLRIAGKTVVAREFMDCTLSWSDGPSGVPGQYRSTRTIELIMDMGYKSGNCVRAARLAPAVMRELAKPVPKPVAPQRPLTYRPGEPDVAAAGACVDLWQARSCAPYKPVPAPRGADEVLRQVQADPNAACAIAADTVRKQLGPAFRPVTDQRRKDPNGPYECAFVEPSHRLTVWVGVAPPKPGHTVYPTLRIAGLPASTGSTEISAEPGRTVRLDTLVVDVTEQIELTVGFEYGEPRSPVSDPPVKSLDSGQLTRLRQVATGIVAGHF
jgi:hypothetical protein